MCWPGSLDDHAVFRGGHIAPLGVFQAEEQWGVALTFFIHAGAGGLVRDVDLEGRVFAALELQVPSKSLVLLLKQLELDLLTRVNLPAHLLESSRVTHQTPVL